MKLQQKVDFCLLNSNPNKRDVPVCFSLSVVLLTLECSVLTLFIRFCSCAVSLARPSHRSSLLESKASSCLFMHAECVQTSASPSPLMNRIPHPLPDLEYVQPRQSNSFKMHYHWLKNVMQWCCMQLKCINTLYFNSYDACKYWQ